MAASADLKNRPLWVAKPVSADLKALTPICLVVLWLARRLVETAVIRLLDWRA
jgi:hypothetical protein